MEEARNFIEAFVQEDLSEGNRCYGMQVHTRFPPEPNGYLHIGHCKALTIDFSTAERFGGLRHQHGILAEELQDQLLLPGRALQQRYHGALPRGVHIPHGADHFRTRAVAALLKAEQAERPVGNTGQRS